MPSISLGMVLSMQVPVVKAMDGVCDDGPVGCNATSRFGADRGASGSIKPYG